MYKLHLTTVFHHVQPSHTEGRLPVILQKEVEMPFIPLPNLALKLADDFRISLDNLTWSMDKGVFSNETARFFPSPTQIEYQIQHFGVVSDLFYAEAKSDFDIEINHYLENGWQQI